MLKKMKKNHRGIICTIGPASDRPDILRQMLHAGMSIARLNFSHGTLKEHLRRIQLIRLLGKRNSRRIGLLQDLEGYRIRIGRVDKKGGIVLRKRDKLCLTNEPITAEKGIVSFDYAGPLKDIKAGSHIFIDDGSIVLVVKSVSQRRLFTEVVIPGVLKEHKGVNIPDVHLSFKGLTEKDNEDIAFGLRHRVEYIAQSFVRTAEDVLLIREKIGAARPSCRIIAKIDCRRSSTLSHKYDPVSAHTEHQGSRVCISCRD